MNCFMLFRQAKKLYSVFISLQFFFQKKSHIIHHQVDKPIQYYSLCFTELINPVFEKTHQKTAAVTHPFFAT